MTISTQTFEGVPGGMNVALPGEEIADNEARYLQDVLLHFPGLVVRRGPLQQFAGTPFFVTPVTGLVQTLDPTGANRLAVLRGDTSNGYFSVLNTALSSYIDLPWNGALPTAPPNNPYRIVDAKSALTGGTWIGTSSQYNANGPVQTLALWRGANVADYTAGTVTATRGSTTVTGSGTIWVGNVTPGSFLFADTDADSGSQTYIGVVKSVDSNTQVTLGVGALHAITAKTYKFTSIRGFAPRVVKGRITCATGSTTVTGANTKFLSQGVNSGIWNLYRASDYTWIGKVTTVNNDTSITLAANAAIALNNERYIAHRRDADFNLSTMSVAERKVGFLNAVYAERNWYSNLGQRFELTSRLWFSDPSDPEAVDMSAFDGDFVDVGSSRGANSPIKAICPTYNALAVFKENESFGIFGSSPTQFEVRKIEDDGTLGGMSVQPYGGGVIWAGREGIHFYDGIQAENITQPKLGDYYKSMIRSFDPTKYRMWSMMMREHYMLFIEAAVPNIPVIKGAVSTTPTKLTIVINMNSRSVVLFTNVNIRGSVIMPADTGQETWYVVNGQKTQNLDALNVTFAGTPTFNPDSSVTLDSPDQVFVPSSNLNKTTGWFAIRFKANIVNNSFNRIMSWRNTSAERLELLYQSADAGFELARQTSSAGAVLDGGSTIIAGNVYTVIGKWDANNLYLSINGAAFTSVANTSIPVGLPATFIIGNNDTPNRQLNGDVYWAAAGTGTLTNADATTINGFGNTDHAKADFPGTPTFMWAAEPSQVGYLCSATDLFDSIGNDVVSCDLGTAGPDFYMESKKYNTGDALRLKLFKQLAINYLAQGDNLKVDTVVGLNNIGRTAKSELLATVFTWDNLISQFGTWDNLAATMPTWDAVVTSVFKPKKLKFLKRSQNLAFRVYQKSNAVNNVRLGPFQIGFKVQRAGRI